LSGTKHFLVYVDGKPLGSDGSIPYEAGRSVMSLTVENLAPGRHTVEVSAVDNALNEGPKSSELVVYVDTDVPRLFIKTPAAAGLHLGARPVVSALATDNAGITAVAFEVDGSRLGTVTPSAPQTQFTATKTLDLSGFASGTHTLRVTARDVAGRTVTATRTFVLDKTAPVISSVSGAPSPFFPRKRDGYKDNFKMKFTTSEAGTAKVVIKNSSGKVVRTLTKSVGAGSQSLLWNGKQTDGAMKSGTFKWTLTMTDASGNARSVSARSVTIKFYEIVRTGSGSVRIVSR
jgi:flagellar hook assembly protein FlgD